MKIDKREKRKSPTQSNLPFEIDPEPATETITSYAGIPLIAQAFRALGVAGSVASNVKVKERDRGYDEATMVESFVILNAAGGESLDDFQRLREDPGLEELIGHELPSPAAARKFLYQFHDDQKVEEAKQQRLPDEKAYIPEETERLQGLGLVNRHIIQEYGRRMPAQKKATVDQDATIIDSNKREALRTYEGGKGYQPMLTVWAETNLILADEFRDGNVPAAMSPLASAKAAFSSLPPTVEEFYFRGDSACHESDLLDWLKNEQREDGPSGKIGFAISARMSQALRKTIEGVEPDQWLRYDSEDENGNANKNRDEDVIRECADVVFVSNEEAKTKHSKPLRYIAIRITKKQGELFDDGNQVKHFAVVTNIWDWTAAQVLSWHRKKAGTIEGVNDVIKNELAGGVMPCGRFGANAAWLRLAVISFNLIVMLKLLALPTEVAAARPKRLRFLLFNTAGKVVHHARKVMLKIVTTAQRLTDYWINAVKTLIIIPTG